LCSTAAREEELAAAGHTASSAAFDVTDKSAVRLALGLIDRQLGRLDILVTNAASSAATCCTT